MPGGDQALIQCLFQIVTNPQHFSGGFHFRSQMGVHVSQLLKGEHRYLYRHIGEGLVEVPCRSPNPLIDSLSWSLVAKSHMGTPVTLLI